MKGKSSTDTERSLHTTAPIHTREHQEELLDEAAAESFPASDPIAPAVAERIEPGDVRARAGMRRSGARTLTPLLVLGVAMLAWLTLRGLRGLGSGRSGPR
jgi:hypothetical protein